MITKEGHYALILRLARAPSSSYTHGDEAKAIQHRIGHAVNSITVART